MRILALDLSTHAGYAVIEKGDGAPELRAHGTVHLGSPVSSFGPYPDCYRRATRLQVDKIWETVKGLHPVDAVVVEETNLGRDRYVQKLLEFLHLTLLGDLSAGTVAKQVVYLDSSEWRRNLGLKLSKDQRRQNTRLSRARRAAEEAGAKLDKAALGIRGKVTWKHLSVAKANEVFGLQLKMKDNDAADAICVGLAYLGGARPCDGE